MNKGVKFCCKIVITQVFTVVDLLVGISADIAKPKGYIEVSLSIR